jgi:hypothetical protein
MEKPRPAPAQPQSVAISPSESNRPPARTDADPAANPVVRGRGADCAHCLRPLFTARLSRDLDRGAAINLIAAAGQGGGRLLADLKRLADEGQARGPRLLANLKRHRASLAGLTADLWQQAGLDGDTPAGFGDLCDRLARQAPGGALLLDHFDALLGNPDLDPGYDDRFLDALNALCNRGLGLVCVSAARIDGRPLLMPGRVRTTSTLDLTRETLPALMHAEITTELARRDPALDDAERSQLALAVLADGQPAAFLELALKHIGDGRDADLPLSQRLKRWQRVLLAERMMPTPRGLLRLRDAAITTWRLAGLDRLPLREIADWVKGVLRLGGGKQS